MSPVASVMSPPGLGTHDGAHTTLPLTALSVQAAVIPTHSHSVVYKMHFYSQCPSLG